MIIFIHIFILLIVTFLLYKAYINQSYLSLMPHNILAILWVFFHLAFMIDFTTFTFYDISKISLNISIIILLFSGLVTFYIGVVIMGIPYNEGNNFNKKEKINKSTDNLDDIFKNI